MDSATAHRVQLRVGFVLAAGALTYAVVTALSRAFESGTGLRAALFAPDVIASLAVALAGALSTLHDAAAARLSQALLFFAGGIAYILTNEPGDLGGISLIVYSFVLALQYGFLRSRFVVKMTVCLAVVLAATSGAALVHGRFLHGAAIAPIVFTTAYLYLVWVAIEGELSEYRELTRRLHAEAEANRVFVELGRGLTGLVHGLRAKLSAIDGANELLASSPASGDPELREPIELQRRSIDQMIESIDDLLATVRSYRRTEEGRMSLSRTIRASVDSALASGELRSRIATRFDVSPDDTIVAPPSAVTQILDSLVRNACDSMRAAREPTLAIRIAPEGAGVVCTITDSGHGVPFCRICRVPDCMWCDEFHIGRSTKPGGYGIGVVHARELLRRTGGWLRYAAGRRSGTSVSVWFPRDGA